MLYQKIDILKYQLVILASLLLLGCSNSPKIVFKDKGYQNVVWTAEEKKKDIAVRHLARSDYSSSHLLRVKGAEKPHYHDEHDLSVTVISGKSIIHFKDHEVLLEQGDVVSISKGTYHWAENIDSDLKKEPFPANSSMRSK